MEYELWEPVYLEILKDMGYDLDRDVESARLLDSVCPRGRICDDDCVSKLIMEEVTVVGHGPDLEDALERFEPHGGIIAADGASSHLLDMDIVPALIVTDLDGDVPAELKCNAMGSVVAIHAHGDNMEAIRRHASSFEGMVIPTVQCRPFGCLRNYGGFTDGDRGVLLAAHFGARRVRLVGFDFDSPRRKGGGDSRIKLRKLAWARRIIFDICCDIEIIMD